jgi:putative transposase
MRTHTSYRLQGLNLLGEVIHRALIQKGELEATQFPECIEPNPEHASPVDCRILAPHEDSCYLVTSRLTGEQCLWGREEKRMFRFQLEKTARYCGVEILNFVVMDNHFHLLLSVPRQASRKELPSEIILDRISFLHEEIVSKLLAQALGGLGSADSAADVALAADFTKLTALEHFGRALIDRGAPLQEPTESAAAWAARELERHRGLMHDLVWFMRLLKQRFTLWYNNNHERFGTLWATNFRSVLISPNGTSLQAVSAYIDMNPVRAGLVTDPSEYEFCGLAEAMGGSGMARDGLRMILLQRELPSRRAEEGEILAEQARREEANWSVLADSYASLLWGNSRVSGVNGTEVAPGRPKSVDELPSLVGRAPVWADFFRHRHRVFLEGLAFGAKDYLLQVFANNRARFDASFETVRMLVSPRSRAAVPHPGWGWPGMAVLLQACLGRYS